MPNHTGATRLPLIPRPILEAHDVHQQGDTRFAASARLLQSLWREKNGYPSGSKETSNGPVSVGNKLSHEALPYGLTFLHPSLVPLLRKELIYREEGAVYEEERLWGNLLSSQALCFNLFGFMKLNPQLANEFFRKLLLDVVDEVSEIYFEHSPGRGDPRFTEDQTAFDIFVRCRMKNGKQGFLAIEMKYTEAVSAGGAYHPAYDDLSGIFKLFRDGDDPELRKGRCQQFWREHLLAESALAELEKYQDYRFIVIHPAKNRQCSKAVAAFSDHLVDPLRFQAITLETCIEALRGLDDGLAEMLYERYLDFGQIDELLEAELAAPVPTFNPNQKTSDLKAVA